MGVRLASWNVHCGVDGWGRPFDVVGTCRQFDADLLVLQESWRPDGGASTAERVADALGYDVHQAELARGRLYGPDPEATDRWRPPPGHAHDTLRLDDIRPGRRAAYRQRRPHVTGTWSLAVLTRVPVRAVDVCDLGRLPRDGARRAAISCTIDVAGTALVVTGTHMSHLLQWSPIQYRRLRATLPRPDVAAALLGDMNLWGPAVVAQLPGWQRVVRGRTWPTWRPHSQIDHILVNRAAVARGGGVAGPGGSDHRPVVATVAPVGPAAQAAP